MYGLLAELLYRESHACGGLQGMREVRIIGVTASRGGAIYEQVKSVGLRNQEHR